MWNALNGDGLVVSLFATPGTLAHTSSKEALESDERFQR